MILALVDSLRAIHAARSLELLAGNVAIATTQMGFTHYAITHHVDGPARRMRAIRLNNYPPAWVEHYDRHHLYTLDPVHRLSHLINEGFVWSELAERIDLSHADHAFMTLAAHYGIADGFTIPVTIHGETGGSVTFINPPRREITDLTKIMAHAIGEAAFAAARRLCTPRGQRMRPPSARLTQREREVTHLVALGKTNREMAMLMGTSEETPAKHVNNCFEKLEVNKRTLLVSRALFDGTLTLAQILPQFYSPFRE
ncbi:helix-turn-helix transcriptional regulator [Novosphingobium resinovorum]|nr:LuxR family transcriptional regulator [Novosphingobium resinovorum]